MVPSDFSPGSTTSHCVCVYWVMGVRRGYGEFAFCPDLRGILVSYVRTGTGELCGIIWLRYDVDSIA